jgi:predicted transcriptional regulator
MSKKKTVKKAKEQIKEIKKEVKDIPVAQKDVQVTRPQLLTREKIRLEHIYGRSQLAMETMQVKARQLADDMAEVRNQIAKIDNELNSL